MAAMTSHPKGARCHREVSFYVLEGAEDCLRVSGPHKTLGPLPLRWSLREACFGQR